MTIGISQATDTSMDQRAECQIQVAEVLELSGTWICLIGLSLVPLQTFELWWFDWITRAWLHKDLKSLSIKSNAKWAQKREHQTKRQVPGAQFKPQ